MAVGIMVGGADLVSAQGNQAGRIDSVALAASIPPATREDLDTTTAPCEDFYQHATGGWYHRMEPLALEERDFYLGNAIYPNTQLPGPGVWAPYGGKPSIRPYEQLRQLVARAPGLARTTEDPALRVVGYFYGSCLADTSGTAEGTVGDTARASYCFRTTRRYLDRALFELFIEHIWPPAARVAASQLAANVMNATIARIRASKALSAYRRERLMAKLTKSDFYLGYIGNGERPPVNTMALQKLWRTAPRWPAGVRGPSGMVFTGPEVERTWAYRNYSRMRLSPTAFRDNVARVQAAPDTVPLPVLPNSVPVLDALNDGDQFRGGQPFSGSTFWRLNLAQLVPPLVNGKVDLGSWYGSLWMEGHEIAEQAWLGMLDRLKPNKDSVVPEAELAAFAEEQFRGQMPFYNHHTAFDYGGLVVFHDAFQRAKQDWPTTKIDGFTPEQRFFLGAAWGYRWHFVSQSILRGVGRFRAAINGTLSILPTFAQAFGCQAGDPMAGGHLWYQAPWHNIVFSAEQRDALAQEYDSLLTSTLKKLRVELTAEQKAAFTQRRQTHGAQRRALFGEPGKAGRIGSLVETYRFLGQELADARAVLTPEQRERFDKAVAKLNLGVDAKAYLTIPGMSS